MVVVAAPAAAVWAALVDPAAVGRWRVPPDMTAAVQSWAAHEGGRFRVTLSYRDAGRTGKTAGASDTYEGRFVELVPQERVVEELAFVAADPGLAGEMRMTWTLTPTDTGTRVELRHEGVPDAVDAADNAAGTRMALQQLAAYVEERA